MSAEFIASIQKKIAAGLVKEAAEECLESAPVAFSNDPQFLRSIIRILATEIAQGKPTRPRPAVGGKFYGQRRIGYVEHDEETGATFKVERRVSQKEFERLAIDSAQRGTHESAGKDFAVDADTIKKYKGKAKRKK